MGNFFAVCSSTRTANMHNLYMSDKLQSEERLSTTPAERISLSTFITPGRNSPEWDSQCHIALDQPEQDPRIELDPCRLHSAVPIWEVQSLCGLRISSHFVNILGMDNSHTEYTVFWPASEPSELGALSLTTSKAFSTK